MPRRQSAFGAFALAEPFAGYRSARQAAAQGTWTHLLFEMYLNRIWPGDDSQEFRMLEPLAVLGFLARAVWGDMDHRRSRTSARSYHISLPPVPHACERRLASAIERFFPYLVSDTCWWRFRNFIETLEGYSAFRTEWTIWAADECLAGSIDFAARSHAPTSW